ncbi:MAG: hypothetical protein J6Y70_00360 [Bacilli bacterium]|nr:hypothetical protein [Bacilli bacterium]
MNDTLSVDIEKIKSIAKEYFLDFDEKKDGAFFLEEFNIFLHQLHFFLNDKNIDNYKPANFPFKIFFPCAYLRDDIVEDIENDILKNTKNKVANQIKIPKVI